MRLAWFQDVLRYVENHGALVGTFIEHKKPDRYLGYVVLMSNINDSDPSSYEEATEQQVWKDVMT